MPLVPVQTSAISGTMNILVLGSKGEADIPKQLPSWVGFKADCALARVLASMHLGIPLDCISNGNSKLQLVAAEKHGAWQHPA